MVDSNKNNNNNNNNCYGKELVGRRVLVLWKVDSGILFPFDATITDYRERENPQPQPQPSSPDQASSLAYIPPFTCEHLLVFDDGDTRFVNLQNLKESGQLASIHSRCGGWKAMFQHLDYGIIAFWGIIGLCLTVMLIVGSYNLSKMNRPYYVCGREPPTRKELSLFPPYAEIITTTSVTPATTAPTTNATDNITTDGGNNTTVSDTSDGNSTVSDIDNGNNTVSDIHDDSGDYQDRISRSASPLCLRKGLARGPDGSVTPIYCNEDIGSDEPYPFYLYWASCDVCGDAWRIFRSIQQSESWFKLPVISSGGGRSSSSSSSTSSGKDGETTPPPLPWQQQDMMISTDLEETWLEWDNNNNSWRNTTNDMTIFAPPIHDTTQYTIPDECYSTFYSPCESGTHTGPMCGKGIALVSWGTILMLIYLYCIYPAFFNR